MGENLQNYFLFLQELVFAKKTTFMRNTHFMRIKFSELSKKDILPVAVNIFMRLKKAFTRLVRELICPIPIIIILKYYISGVKIRAG